MQHCTGAVHCPAPTTVSTVHVTDIPFLGKPMQLHWCCVAPTDVCTCDIPILRKPMQLHWWYCLAPTTVCIPEQAFRRSAVQFPRWVIPNPRTMKRDLCPISATSAPNLMEGPFISKTCSPELWNRNFG